MLLSLSDDMAYSEINLKGVFPGGFLYFVGPDQKFIVPFGIFPLKTSSSTQSTNWVSCNVLQSQCVNNHPRIKTAEI